MALAVCGHAAVNVPLTVQEAIYPGSVAGIDRSGDPLTVGIPLPDDPTNGISDVNQLTLSGASVGQFRVLGRWPSGRIKWVLVDTQATLAAGQQNTGISLVSGGAGNFGGSNLAVDNGATITINTGVATFTVRKAGFNVIDQAVIGNKTVMASGSSQGLVVTGPAPGKTTCPPCTTIYSSANDTASTATIEENGPAKVVVVATGSHVDNAGNAYMRFTVRLYFYRNKSGVKVNSVLRNADYGASNSFETAYKGFQAYELRMSPALTGTPQYAIANHSTVPTTGTLGSTDTVYLYQGESQQMKAADWCGYGCLPYTNDKGYQIVKNGTAAITGVDTQYPQGWADVQDSTGAGVEIGVYQLSAYWPKSLEFNAGGSDVRIGIWARQNSQPYYQNWPQYSIHDLFLNFHAAPLASPANEFLKFQHYLLARAPLTHYNATGVFPYPLNDPSTEDSFYRATGTAAVPALSASSACCVQDYGTADIAHWPMSIYRYYAWHSPGGANQTEFRWSGLMNFLSRGWAGRYIDAGHFYRFQAESAWPHSDGFNWRDKTGEYNGFGFPKASSLNSSLAILNSQNWLDSEHGHWYGMPDYYFLTGDETIKDALLDGTKDYFLNKNTYQYGAGGGVYNTRSIGVNLIGAARMAQFLAAIGDADASSVLALGVNDFGVQVKPELCVSGYPAGCVLGPPDGGPWNTQGVSRTRGIPWGAAGTSGTWCGVSHAYRGNSSFQPAILVQGLMEFRNVMGPSWADYDLAADLAYGIAQWNLSENYVDNGSGRWDVNGFRFGLAMDVPNSCTNPGETPEPDFQPVATQTTSMTFLAKYLTDGSTDWATKFKINLQRDMAALGTNTSDFGSYQIAAVINVLNNPTNPKLVSAPITSFTDNGGGSYTIGWTVPSNAQRYRVKWGSKKIVEWVGFDPTNNVFTGDPSTTMPWFAATNASGIPAPGGAGSTQSMTVSTGVSGLTAANFSVKTAVGGTATAPTTTGPAATLTAVSGSGQTGTAGQNLSSPFTVRVADASNNPVAGATVVFAVTAGGGSLSATNATSDSYGYASSTLKLGPAAGTNTVTATSGTLTGSPVTFTATATAGGPGPAKNLVMVSGNGQSGPVSQALSAPFVVRVTDANGVAVPGTVVTFTVTAGGGSLSATSATTDSQGLAATMLTLGANAGTVTVSATSGTLAGSPATFTATATSAPVSTASVSVTWSNPSATTGWVGYNGWQTLWFDPVSKQTLLYGVPGNSTSIYSSTMFAYNTNTNLFTQIAGTGTTTNACPRDTTTQPGDRHPGWQMSVDTKRNVLWMFGGVNVNCSDASGPDSNPRQDTYYLQLNADPKQAGWQQVKPAHTPKANGVAAMMYDSDDDVLFVFGYDGSASTHDNWVYCPTSGNPTPGTLTLKQSAAGCAAPDDWTEVAVANGVQPAGSAFPGLVYDPVTHKGILFGGNSSSLTVSYNQTWAYDVPTRTWTQKALATVPPPPYSGGFVAQPSMAYDSKRHVVFYHQTSNSGAPADWQYDPVADTWTKLTTTSAGPAVEQILSYDPVNDAFVGFGRDPATFRAQIWLGRVSGSSSTTPPAANRCDLNGSGAVDQADIDIAVKQTLNTALCTTADLNGDGVCNVVDIQRLVNAAMGKGCIVGQ